MNLKRQIRDVEQIYSRILSDPVLEKDLTMQVIAEAFESDDTLKPIACLSNIMTDIKAEEFLTKKQFGRGLTNLSTIILVATGIVSAVAAVIPLFRH